MDPGYAATYRELHRRHWWWRARRAVVLRELDRLRPQEGWNRALDVGCGGGLLFDDLLERARDVEGVEPDAELIDPEGPHAHRIHHRPFDPSFHPSTAPFDLVLMLDVLEHMDERVRALAHARELLEEDGVLLLTVPALPLLWTSHDELNEHRLRYTRDTLAGELRQSGFRIRTLRYFFHWTVAGKLVQRGLEALTGGEPSPPRIPPEPVNRILEGLSRVEQVLARPIPLPFGSSLLAVAEP